METETWPSPLLPPKLFVMEDLHRFSTWGKHGQEYGALSPLSFQAKTAILTQEGQVSDIITPHPPSLAACIRSHSAGRYSSKDAVSRAPCSPHV